MLGHGGLSHSSNLEDLPTKGADQGERLIPAQKTHDVEFCMQLARSQWLILLSLFAAVEILAVTTMITMIVKAAQSARFSRRTLKEDLETSDKYESQIFELGTWACETEDLPSFVGSYSLAAQCGLSTTLRVSIVLQLILISLSFAIVWWDKSGNRNLFAEPRYMPDEDGDSDVELE